MKKITFNEYSYVLHRYPIEVEISDEDFKLLSKGELTLEEITDKYNVNYGCSVPIYDDMYVDSYNDLKIE